MEGKRCRSAATMSRVSSTDSVVWVRKASFSGSGGASAATSSTDSTSVIAPSGYRSEEHTSELQSLMRSSYAVFCLQKKNIINKTTRQYKQHNDHNTQQK